MAKQHGTACGRPAAVTVARWPTRAAATRSRMSASSTAATYWCVASAAHGRVRRSALALAVAAPGHGAPELLAVLHRELPLELRRLVPEPGPGHLRLPVDRLDVPRRGRQLRPVRRRVRAGPL